MRQNRATSELSTENGLIFPYGDTQGDGGMQLSFTLPLPHGAQAQAAAKMLCSRMGLHDARIAYSSEAAPGFSFFIVYARCPFGVDVAALEIQELDIPDWSKEIIENLIHWQLSRPIVVVGACTGSDAHTVGLDAILGMKGCYGEVGLERYEGFVVHNLGAQVSNEQLLAKADEVRADAILVSQMVTQKEVHRRNLLALIKQLDAVKEHTTDSWQPICVLGGARITHEMAVQIGFDAGFGPGTTPREVAAFLVKQSLQNTKSGEV